MEVDSTVPRPARGRKRSSETELRTFGDAVEALESDTVRLRGQGRELLGIGGASPSLNGRDIVRAPGWSNLLRLCALAAVDGARITALVVVSAQVSTSLGIANLSVVSSYAMYASVIVALGVGAWVARGMGQGRLATCAGFLSGLILLSTAVATNIWLLLLLGIAGGAAGGVVIAVHRPLIMESFPPGRRVRAVSIHTGALGLGLVATLGLAVGLEASGLSWRTLMLALGFVSLFAAGWSRGLTDPVPGRLDSWRIEELVRDHVGTGDAAPDLQDPDVHESLFAGLREVVGLSCARSALNLAGLFGLVVWPIARDLNLFLESRWAMGWSARFLALMGFTLAGVVGVVLTGRLGERAFAVSPSRLLLVSGQAVIVAGVALTLGVSVHVFAIMLFMLSLTYVGLFMVLPGASVLLLSLVRLHLRVYASVALGIAIVVGGLIGQSLLDTIESRFGVIWAFFVLSLAIVGIGLSCVRAGRRSEVEPDVARLVDSIVEMEELRCRASLGQHLPLLSCRHINFSYGQVQVLFDVDFTVDDGELVALLGTNGAGKSTLLKVISGVVLPSHGLVHYRGAGITSLEAERRVQLGISQVPGGRSIFGELSVVENLRMYGYIYRKDRRLIEKGIDATFDAFPRLASRRDQLASTLSGGEQQMLGLGKAFIQNPRVLLVDELSLGLAPIIVGALMDMVRNINETGTAVVVVEQSVNVALSLANHAYFMEKGEIRFDGEAQQLLDRPDLLRAVFLGGAANGKTIGTPS
jgi:ABC-type branched-subunit amino acid transport system ATPase component